MLEELSRLLGLDGFALKAVRERGDELDLDHQVRELSDRVSGTHTVACPGASESPTLGG